MYRLCQKKTYLHSFSNNLFLNVFIMIFYLLTEFIQITHFNCIHHSEWDYYIYYHIYYMATLLIFFKAFICHALFLSFAKMSTLYKIFHTYNKRRKQKNGNKSEWKIMLMKRIESYSFGYIAYQTIHFTIHILSRIYIQLILNIYSDTYSCSWWSFFFYLFFIQQI